MHVLTNIDTSVLCLFFLPSLPTGHTGRMLENRPSKHSYFSIYPFIYFLASTCSAIHQSESMGDISSSRYSCTLIKAEHDVPEPWWDV